MPASATSSGRVERLGRSNRATLLGSMVSAALGFALLLVLTNGLGADDAGIVLIAVAAANIAIGAALLGTDASLVRFIASATRAGHPEQSRRLTLVGAAPVAVAGVVLAAVGWWSAEPLAELMVDGAVGDEHVDSMRVAALLVPVGALSLSLLAATRGTGSMIPTVWFDQIVRPVAQTALLIAVVVGSFSVPAATGAWLGPFVLSLLGALVWLGRYLPPGSSDGVDAGAFWRFSIPQAGTGLLRVMIRWVDTLVVGALLGVRAAAIYTAATRLLKLGSIVNQAVFRAAAPQIAEELSVDDRAGAQSIYRTSANWLVLATWPLYLGCLVYAPTVLSVFGDEFTEGAPAVRILAAALLVAAACGPVESVLVMSGRSGLNLANNTVALAANVGFGLLLIPHWGLEGAAVAWAISVGLTNLLPLAQVARKLSITPFDGVMVRTMLGLGVAFGAAALIVALLGDGWLGLVVSGGVAAIIAAADIWRRRGELALRELIAGEAA
ncbi:MAG: polysaccharide biosynthesis C-terminal domain-containing protein [Acidimicrobiales bacterium]